MTVCYNQYKGEYMNPGTKYWGRTGSNDRYDCPYCTDTRGRFYIKAEGTNIGSYMCHNCGVKSRKGLTEEEIEAAYLLSLTGAEEERLYWVEPVTTFSQSDDVKRFLITRGIPITQDKYRTIIYMLINGKDPEKKCYAGRLILSAYTFDKNRQFYNMRALDSSNRMKVLFPSSSYANIAKKTRSLLWNPNWVINKNKKTIPVICEGDMGAWSVYYETDKYQYVGVATFGKYISTDQAKFFTKFEKLLYFPDNDVSYREINNNLRTLYYEGCDDIKVYDKSQYTGPKDDPNDLIQENKDFFNLETFKTINTVDKY